MVGEIISESWATSIGIRKLLVETNELLHEVHQATVHTLFKELQTKPESFALRIDSEAARAARNIAPRAAVTRGDQVEPREDSE
jgi:sulfur carrier protein ThiS